MQLRNGLALLRPHLRPSRRRIALAAVALVFKDSPLWVLPLVTAEVIDLLINGAAPDALIVPGLWAGAVILVNVGANAVYVRSYSAAVRDLGLRLRGAVASRLQILSIGFHARSSSAVMQTKVIRDVENVELMLQQSFAPILNAASILIGACTIIALRVPSFLAVIALTVPLAVVLMRWLRTRTATANERFRQEVESLSSSVGEMSALLPITRAHGLEQVALERVAASAEQVRTAGYALDRLNGRFGAISWASFQMLSLCCLFGAVLLSLTGALPVTAGDVVLLSSYFGLLTGTLVTAFQLAPLITRGFESLRSVDEVLRDEDVERNEGKPGVETVRGQLSFSAVTFGYGRDEVLHGLDLEIAPGETIAFVGPSGSGKSTILNLALGFLTPWQGRVTIDGRPLTDIDLRSYRRHVSVVPQEPVLFSGTIRENVTYGLADVPDDVVAEALRRANATEFVDAQEHGWNTPIGERGGRLSGGQRQRIAIARALIRDPRVLLLDEATSALDPTAEVEVQAALDELRRGRTTLIVAHRLGTIRSADCIAVLDHGRLVESGTHEQLRRRGGAYARLVAVATDGDERDPR
jgi:ATP-binding cassette subfamily B protein